MSAYSIWNTMLAIGNGKVKKTVSSHPCPHGPYSLEEKRNTKLVDRLDVEEAMRVTRSVKTMELDNR